MITRQTVFVIGAGSSMPYGFPSGDQLVDGIVQLALDKPISNTFNYAGFKNEEVRRFGQDLANSDAPSIDAFLEHRPEFLNICKLAIAMQLARKEVDSTLTRSYREDVDSHVGGRAWYHYLWKEMLAEKGHFGDNKAAFVTFNYDRSLERYFFLRLRALHGYKIADEAFDDLYGIRFVHIYGSLGDDRFMEYPYNKTSFSVDDLKKISARLRMIHKDPAGTPNFAAAIELLQDAERICFLGYGFHDLNNDGLQLRTMAADDRRGDQAWFASRFQMTEVGSVGSGLSLYTILLWQYYIICRRPFLSGRIEFNSPSIQFQKVLRPYSKGHLGLSL